MILKLALFFALFLGLTFNSHAAEKVDWKDKDGDGVNETQLIMEGDKIIKELVDKNKDNNPDMTIYYEKGLRHHAEAASHFDGKIDSWYLYSEKGGLRQTGKDTNDDGKPDRYTTMLKGRNLMLKENDKNFDGRIDQRKLVTWSPTKLKVPGQPAIPGYVSLRVEEDKDFDGKIDAYREKGNKNAGKDKIGKPIDGNPAPAKEEEPPSPPKEGAERAEERIKRLNEQRGLES